MTTRASCISVRSLNIWSPVRVDIVDITGRRNVNANIGVKTDLVNGVLDVVNVIQRIRCIQVRGAGKRGNRGGSRQKGPRRRIQNSATASRCCQTRWSDGGLQTVQRDDPRTAILEQSAGLGVHGNHAIRPLIGSHMRRTDGVDPDVDKSGGLEGRGHVRRLPAMMDH